MKHENRALGAREKVFWLLDQAVQVHLVMAAEMTGSMPIQQWRSSLDDVQKRHPLLSVCIESNGYRYPHFRHVEGMQIPLRIVNGSLDVEQEMAWELSTPIEWQNAPLLRTALLQKDNRTTFILALHHSIGDGVSGNFIIRDLLSALTGKKLDPLPMPPSIDGLLKLPDPPEKQGRPESIPVLTRDHQMTPVVHVLKLPGDLTAKLLDRSRKEGTTVHGALCTAFMKAHKQLLKKGKITAPFRVVSPYTLRQAIGAGEGVCLYFGAKTTLFEQDNDIPFWDLARYARNELTGADLLDIQKGYETLQQQVFSTRLSTERLSDFLQINYTRELMMSNLVRWPFGTDFGSLKLETVLGPINLSGNPGEYTIGAITTNGALSFASATLSPAVSLLPATVDILHSALV
jgi:hypothetical protein